MRLCGEERERESQRTEDSRTLVGRMRSEAIHRHRLRREAVKSVPLLGHALCDLSCSALCDPALATWRPQ